MTVVLTDHRHRGVFIDNCHMLNNATADRDLGVATSILLTLMSPKNERKGNDN